MIQMIVHDRCLNNENFEMVVVKIGRDRHKLIRYGAVFVSYRILWLYLFAR